MPMERTLTSSAYFSPNNANAPDFIASSDFINLVSTSDELLITSGGMYNANIFNGGVTFPTTMRTSPTADVVTGTNYWKIVSEGGDDSCDALGINRDFNTQLHLEIQTNLSRTSGTSGVCRTGNASAFVGFAAEL